MTGVIITNCIWTTTADHHWFGKWAVIINSGTVPVRAMIWTRGINAEDWQKMLALADEGHHLNFYANLNTFR